MKSLISVFPALVLGLGSLYATEWGYEGKGAPSHWGSLDNEFKICEVGKMQSPINITNAVKSVNTHHFDINYITSSKTDPIDVVNNGHSIQVNFRPSNFITFDNQKYQLLQLHFHSPAEFAFDGVKNPFEMHLVHKNDKGELLVINVDFKLGKPNEAIELIWKFIPKEKGQKNTTIKNVKLTALLPKNLGYYYFKGSLTTPPCTENVKWIVLKTPLSVSKEQVEIFHKTMGFDNNRPIQPTNNREIVEEAN
ncbi:carbonic anhydrase family protein [Helicobacter sp. 11S02596-1]|uniref:carbonic anhydrase n=1 Tax=Helicobacter sp. 11S02596-1 TaxID=1476194 RepID=UPI000BA54C65|nr:carbonic anhydrase family protein [Helicobacter sp. 11S02596-1]PAF41530.1 hypothetical protein BJI48_08400 [Helicobacter sp. 11S02596-1]